MNHNLMFAGHAQEEHIKPFDPIYFAFIPSLLLGLKSFALFLHSPAGSTPNLLACRFHLTPGGRAGTTCSVPEVMGVAPPA
jgi:hypothetical protein